MKTSAKLKKNEEHIVAVNILGETYFRYEYYDSNGIFHSFIRQSLADCRKNFEPEAPQKLGDKTKTVTQEFDLLSYYLEKIES